MKARPTRGEGKRDLECRFYERCLDVAGLKNWRFWNCESCDVFRIFFGGSKMEQRGENKRICDECHERPTISPKHPYCARCLGARGRKAQLLSTSEAKKPQEKSGDTFTVGIQITIPADLFRLIARR